MLQEIKLHTAWQADLNLGPTATLTIKLRLQLKADAVEGEVEFVSPNQEGKKYQLTGKFEHGVITFIYFSNDKSKTSSGAATFKYLSSSETLAGNFAYYSQERDIVDAIRCEFRAA